MLTSGKITAPPTLSPNERESGESILHTKRAFPHIKKGVSSCRRNALLSLKKASLEKERSVSSVGYDITK